MLECSSEPPRGSGDSETHGQDVGLDVSLSSLQGLSLLVSHLGPKPCLSSQRLQRCLTDFPSWALKVCFGNEVLVALR